MRARKYNKRIEFWQTTAVSDGYGGNTISEELITSSWCNITTVASNQRAVQKLTDLGISEPLKAIIIMLRHRNDIEYNSLNQFIKYRGDKYVINNAPVDINFEGVEVEIIAVKESATEVSNINPI